jgi:Raf kinase inhibitor-like YbhB/YbcL family protein
LPYDEIEAREQGAIMKTTDGQAIGRRRMHHSKIWMKALALVLGMFLGGLNAASCNMPPSHQGVDLGQEAAPLVSSGPSGTQHPFILTSPVFQNGDAIPSRYTCDGRDDSPPLAWTGVPPETASLALVIEDPDAPGGTWIHWVVYDIAIETGGLLEGAGEHADLDGAGTSGTNSWGERDYGGPCPPAGTHRYFFHLYALDGSLGLPAGASIDELQNAMRGRVLDEAVLWGTYNRGE